MPIAADSSTFGCATTTVSTSAGPSRLPGELDRVVGATVQEPLAVVGDAREVAVPPHVGPPRPVRVEVALRIVEQPPRHTRPRLGAHQLADLTAHRLAGLVEHVDRHAERGTAERARRDRRDDVRRQEARTHLGAARDVDDRAAPAADHVEVPAPRIFVPRLAGGREHAQRRAGRGRAPARRRAPSTRG